MAHLTRSGRQWLKAALGVFMLIVVLVYCWHWFWQPVAKINPTHWANKAILYRSANPVQSLWLHRRHAAKLNLTQAYELKTEDKTIAVRFTAISYPTFYPTAIRVDFELTNTVDKEFILRQQKALLQQRH